MKPITYFNRHTGQLEIEQVYGEHFLDWTYNSPFGQISLHAMVKRPAFSAWYGSRMNHPQTAAKISPFITQYGMNPDDFLENPDSYRNFNEFFFRKLKPEARPIATETDAVSFPADGRHLGFQNASEIQGVFVKGQQFDLTELLDDHQLAQQYQNGALILSRLCPVDYHRFHIPGETRVINGPLFSVSPIALRKNLSYLWQNKRTITPIETTHGTVLLLEIGATCVGSIHQTFTPGKAVKRGDEKGYFAFGGSSTITIFPPGAIQLAPDLLEHSTRQIELYAQIGSRMATWNS